MVSVAVNEREVWIVFAHLTPVLNMKTDTQNKMTLNSPDTHLVLLISLLRCFHKHWGPSQGNILANHSNKNDNLIYAERMKTSNTVKNGFILYLLNTDIP